MSRKSRLSKLLPHFVNGSRTIESLSDVGLFLDVLRNQPERLQVVEMLVSNPPGLNTIRKFVRVDVSVEFINGPTAALLTYLGEPGLEQLCNGQFLRNLISTLIDPPTFWNALIEAHRNGLLNRSARIAFGWLLFHGMSSSLSAAVRQIALQVTRDRSFLDSPIFELRALGCKIEHSLNLTTTNIPYRAEYKPGGRHDNDFEDFRKISIMPTPDEMASTELPFYRKADEVYEAAIDHRPLIHYDNQFRLLREDLLAELRNDFQIAQGLKQGHGTGLLIHGLEFGGIDGGVPPRRKPCSLIFLCKHGLPNLSSLSPPKRRDFLGENPTYLKHQSFGCLLSGNEIVAFATLDRNESLLGLYEPQLVLDISGTDTLVRVLSLAKEGRKFRFVVVETPVFAFEPILQRLQEKTDFPLANCLLSPTPVDLPLTMDSTMSHMANEIKNTKGWNVNEVLGIQKRISLDPSQLVSLISALTQSVSLIQGPPGTGKSFIGALLTKIWHDYSTQDTILVLTYTNHALDQFLEDLMDIGIPDDSIVRLGGKSSEKTKKLRLTEQNSNGRNPLFSQTHVNAGRKLMGDAWNDLQICTKRLQAPKVDTREILQFLEFEHRDFHGAFDVSNKGQTIDPRYLVDRWIAGRNAGIFQSEIRQEHVHVWQIDPDTRKAYVSKWSEASTRENIADVASIFEQYNGIARDVDDYYYYGKNAALLKNKRLIGCTTTAAAKSIKALTAARPTVILVEEAGEVLESHVLAAMTQDTKQLVMIGDHQQLRPKIHSHRLTVEMGEGYDLNMSLFERLVKNNFPHTTLTTQHRMCPQISHLIRKLTYPNLRDAAKTRRRPRLLGFQKRIIFASHSHPETHFSQITERRDPTTKGTRQNPFEVQMVLKCVRYLAQQGYGTDKIVVLTPYLGQLNLLRRELSKSNDPVLNDLDSYDLVRAGLATEASAVVTKQPIRISTIDNYQGEESDIVVASLTRSNATGDIGFMAYPERLNVLLSRARNALIMIGNAATFRANKRGQEVWQPLFQLLAEGRYMYDGLPIQCQQHPKRKATIRTPNEFDALSPEGGCTEPCSKKLSCGVHGCPRLCHYLEDHTKMECKVVMRSACPKQHTYTWKCHNGAPDICPQCEEQARVRVSRASQNVDLELKLQEQRVEHARKMALIETEANEQKLWQMVIREQREQSVVLSRKTKDLANLKTGNPAVPHVSQHMLQITSQPVMEIRTDSAKTAGSLVAANDTCQTKTEVKISLPSVPQALSLEFAAADEWQRQKGIEGQFCEALDTLMGKIGLEKVKDKFLSIKAKVDTAIRQNTSLEDEKFSAALTGNPGTGKTTIARLYANFLSALGVIPGNSFIEVSGSRLAHDGIRGCQGHLDHICGSGGGVLFIDEAYQLTSGQNPGGGQVLDFLLTEVENLAGMVVFIISGYSKQMESFYAHNQGIPSRFPIEFKFPDYTDKELQNILLHRLIKKYGGRMKVEGGTNGLYTRIVSRRIGRARGNPGFGNAREVHNTLSRISDRQARRLQLERQTGNQPDDFLLTKDDLIGPEPSSVLKGNAAWARLRDLVGLESVKQAVQSLFDTIQTNYQREIEEKPVVEYSLNKVLLGNPGTGKTTVAKLYGQILADLGFLSNGEVIVKNPSDFMGSALGQSEATTKGILASSLGKVLVIDEAYMLYGGSSDGPSVSDPYKTAVIDTIVAEVQSVAGDNRCVLLLGYKDQMERMFQSVNPGLSRRFPLDSAFQFEDFSDDDLQEILDLKLKQIGFAATDQAKKVARECLSRARNQPHFGNAGAVDILLDAAKMRHHERLYARKTNDVYVLDPVDFDPDFDRAERAITNCRKLFDGVVGCQSLIYRFEEYQQTALNAKKIGIDPREQIPFNFLFRGPPGTGKTSTARRMGQVFYDMGFLATSEVIECSATDLIGQYVGQTGPKTKALLEKALGKVLFIDEAYRLAEGHYAKEAMDELVDCLTKPKFAQKIVTILAGYDDDIDRLMSTNPGLTSRFPETVRFEDLTPKQCLTLLQRCLQEKTAMDTSALQKPSKGFELTVLGLFKHLATLPAWGNARDVQTLAKNAANKVLAGKHVEFAITEDVILQAMHSMISERESRQETASSSQDPFAGFPMHQLLPKISMQRPVINATATTVVKQAPSTASGMTQDSRGSDASEETSEPPQNERRTLESDTRHVKSAASGDGRPRQLPKTAKSVSQSLKENHPKAQRSVDPARDKLEEYEEEVRRLVHEKLAKQAKRKEEELQKKLDALGLCDGGFRWMGEGDGYKCGGGNHFVSDSELEAMMKEG